MTIVKAIVRGYKGTLIYIAILALLMALLSMAAPTITHLIISYIKLPAEQKSF
jgi:ABC-type bacteriocin/lantibiotic exporter with double-glycine peptidase domain